MKNFQPVCPVNPIDSPPLTKMMLSKIRKILNIISCNLSKKIRNLRLSEKEEKERERQRGREEVKKINE